MLGEITGPFQRTLKTAIGCRGVGLHSGQRVAIDLVPAPPETGIVFRRTDTGAEIRAVWENAVESARCTVLSNGEGATVGTVEHLMAALAGAAVDNAIVELNGPEVPIMDGSAGPFVFLIECAGIVEQDAPRLAIKVQKPVSVVEHGALAALYPDHGFSMSFEIDFDNPLIRHQDMSMAVDAGSFKSELSRARTFGLLDDVDRLRAAGLARGGSLDNVIVVSGDHVLNSGGLRYEDEFVRHKLLDAIGDLYLAGAPLIGRFRGVRSGHAHNRRLLAALFADDEAWAYTTATASASTGAGTFESRDEALLATA
ncbi:MAG TPA: UDP-3-O-acyl-N-acetylglucosamine deacetylase [Stellaceae bacterium]|jgi:UDP-3-O-[3-hydroxymyristoyl] N-acetylglucosamine deacetylase|nr:UDP-3-O-acyl-N-acetylglucosamine deacetylase [Stellaceae bacterium]